MPFDPHFDLESVYDEQIAPLMAQIIAIAKEHGMPILFSACYRDDGENLDSCSTYIHPPERRIAKFDECRDVLMRKNFFAYAITVTEGGR